MSGDQNQTSPLVRVLDVFGNIFVVNLLFVVFSLPVVTIGASMTAMYSMTLKMVRKEEGPMCRGFWNSFKRNFKQSTIAWIIEIIAIAVLWAEYTLICNFTGTIATVYSVVFFVEIIVFFMIFPLVYPLLASFENTLGNTFKNAFLLSLSNFWGWIKVMLLWLVPTIVSLNYALIILSTWYMWLILFFGLIAYLSSLTINNMFKKIAQTQEENEEFAREKEEKARKEEEAAREKAEREAAARKAALEKIGSASFDEDDINNEE